MARGSGLKKKYEVSEELDEIIRKNPVTRSQAVKKIWEYIKDNDLQDPDDGRIIYADDLLYQVYGKKKLKLTDVGGKKLSEHLFDD